MLFIIMYRLFANDGQSGAFCGVVWFPTVEKNISNEQRAVIRFFNCQTSKCLIPSLLSVIKITINVTSEVKGKP